MSMRNITFDIIETEDDPKKTAEQWRYGKVVEIAKGNMSKNEKTLIITQNNDTTKYIVVEFYVQANIESTMFKFNKDTSSEENNHKIDEFKSGQSILAVATIDVLNHHPFDFVKNIIFLNFPEGQHFQKIFDNLSRNDGKRKITVFELGISTEQTIYLINALQISGNPLTQSLERFITINGKKEIDEMLKNPPIPTPSSVSYAPQVQPAQSVQSVQPTPQIQTSSRLTTNQLSTQIRSNGANENNKNSMVINGQVVKVRSKWPEVDGKWYDEDDICELAKQMSFDKCNFNCTKEQYEIFRSMSENRRNILNNEFMDECWDAIIKGNENVNNYRHETIYTNQLTYQKMAEIIKDLEKQLEMQNNESACQYNMVVLSKQIHILQTIKKEYEKLCLFCDQNDHQSFHCILYPMMEMRQMRCEEKRLCGKCGCYLIKYHKCPTNLICHECNKNGHIRALGHSHPDW